VDACLGFTFGSARCYLAKLFKRYFTETASIGSMYYSVEPQTYPADFKIKFSIVSKSTGEEAILGQESSYANALFITSSNEVGLRLADGAYEYLGTLPNLRNGTLQTGWLERIDGVISAKLGEVDFPNTLANSDPFSFDVIGQRNSGLYFNGIMAELKTWKAGVLVLDPDLSVDFSTTNILENKAAVLGSEALLNNQFAYWTNDDPDGWNVGDYSDPNVITEGANGAHFVTDGLYLELTQPDAMEVGVTYIWEAKVIVNSGAGIAIRDSGGFPSNIVLNVTGTHSGVIKADGAELRITRWGATDAELVYMSLKRADGFGKAVNINESENYTLVDDGVNWLGEELWLAPFTVTTSWTDNGDGSFTVNGSSGSALLTPVELIDSTTAQFIVEFDAVGLGGGGIQLGAGGYIATVDGRHSEVVSGIGNVGFKRVFSSSVGTISNVSIKRLINIA